MVARLRVCIIRIVLIVWIFYSLFSLFDRVFDIFIPIVCTVFITSPTHFSPFLSLPLFLHITSIFPSSLPPSPSLQRKLLSSGEVDALSRDEYGSTLLHTAATYGQLFSLQLLSKEISPSALLLADNNFLTPPLLSIQVLLYSVISHISYFIVCNVM